MTLRNGEVLKGRYRIQSILGEGGMGTVYLAQDLLLDRPRAVKELYPDPLADEAKLHAARVQFEKEARALGELRHKNLPHVNDYFSVDENDYLVMDYIEGESLADILARKKRPTEQLVYDWLKQILDALDFCHRHHILHRDIKPANIILTPEGKVMLVDFSLVKLLDAHNPRTATIVRGVGTPQYTPLEQYDASMGHTDVRSDIYALGATLYHLLTGHPPQPVSQRILNPHTQPPLHDLNPKVSPWMARFVQTSMAIRPNDRYQSIKEMRRQLDLRLFKLRRPAPTQSPTRGAGPSARRQYRHRARPTTRKRPPARDLAPTVREMIPIVLPMVVPVTVILTLTTIATIIVATGSSTAAAIIALPLILSGLVYYKLSSRRRRGPPRF
jgi:serine/threonine-protein kinase